MVIIMIFTAAVVLDIVGLLEKIYVISGTWL